jgi:hypothetical protein
MTDDLKARGVRVKAIRIEGDVAFVPLTKDYEAVIDAADASLIEGFDWYVKGRDGWPAYAARNGKPDKLGRRQTIRMHRFIMGDPDCLVDHINGDGLDNRRSNLRLATPEGNARNRGIGRNSTSGVKGVTKHKGSGKWRAQISMRKTFLHLGLFDTIEEASAAYAAASARLHGEFSRDEAATIRKENP